MPNKKMQLAVFVSGRGSNLQAIIDACAISDFPAEIALVLSNDPDAYGLKRAEEANISICAINHKDYDSRETFEDALLDAISQHDIDLVCLAGFMRILTPHFVNKWANNMINIHPSLLPDYKGLNTHARVLEDGRSESGCSVHYVVAEMDGGPLIVQKRVAVENSDTPDTLAARILEQEHIAYPEAIEMIAKQRGFGV